MKLTNEKYIKFKKYVKISRFFLELEIIIDFFYFVVGLVPIIFYTDYPNNIVYQTLALLIFLFSNMIIKLICLKYKPSLKNRVRIHFPLLIYGIFLMIISAINLNGPAMPTAFLTLFFYFNFQSNYFLFQNRKKHKNKK